MINKYIFQIEFPYWKDKRLLIMLCKLCNKEKYVYRLGIWKLNKLGKEYVGHKGEWGTNWWKFYDIWKGRVDKSMFLLGGWNGKINK